MRFRPEQHLRRQADFDHVRQTGRRYDAGAFTLFYARRRPPATPAAQAASSEGPESADVSAEPVPVAARAPSASAAPGAPARAGFVASRSAVGGAVDRARAKRRLREAFRAHQAAFPADLDLIFVARRSLNRLEHAALQDRFSTLCRKLFPPRAA